MYNASKLPINTQLSKPQSGNVFRYVTTHIMDTVCVLRSIAKTEGVFALWKGMTATMFGVIPARAIYFSTYTHTKQVILANRRMHGEDAWVHLGAAITAGVITATATNPIWMIKTRMQLTPRNDISNIRLIAEIIREEGVRGLYKGMTASYLGVIEGTMQWIMYERMKKSMPDARYGDLFVAAAASKFVAAVIAYPHEVIRTRLRETTTVVREGKNVQVRKYRGLLQAAKLVLKEEGPRALYGGMTAHLMKVVPNSAIMFFCYELLLHAYKQATMIQAPLLLIEEEI